MLSVDNGASLGGTALALQNANAQVLHTTIVRHRATSPGAALLVTYASTLTTVNTILVGHETGIEASLYSQATMTATLWGAGMWANTTNWSVDSTSTLVTGTINLFDVPRFRHPNVGDFHLWPTSPAVDAGVATFVSIDGDGEPRPIGLAPDLGADEVPYQDLDPNMDGEAEFIYTDTQGIEMKMHIPPESITESIKLAITRRDVITEPTPSRWRVAGLAFDMEAFTQGAFLPEETYQFQTPITMTIRYRDQDIIGIPEETLVLQFWDSQAHRWRDIAQDCNTTYRRFPVTNTLEVGVCHLSRFALMGIEAPLRVYLPAVLR
ncbi:MAG: choice-of-anchor Q domain-containing protein [Ardenticatenia bacterium]|nr:choice-of-anchor Q domain-containing protein [Ardenticatenia bacterium]